MNLKIISNYKYIQKYYESGMVDARLKGEPSHKSSEGESMKSTTKSLVLIVEDNQYKAFTTRQVLELKLKLEVKVFAVESERELADKAIEFDPDMVFFRPSGAVSDLLLKLTKRQSNRRNTEVIILTVEELEDNFARKLKEFAVGYSKVAKAA